jgi:hypothetical protein
MTGNANERGNPQMSRLPKLLLVGVTLTLTTIPFAAHAEVFTLQQALSLG